MSLLIASSIVLFSLWIVAHDPTIQRWRRRMRLQAELRGPTEDVFMEDVVAILPQAPGEMSQRHNRRRSGGRLKSSFRSKPSYQKRKAR